MNMKRIVVLAVVALLVGFMCTNCSGGGPVSTVKGFIKAYINGDPERINSFLDKDLQFDEDENIWDDLDADNFEYDIDEKDMKRSLVKMLNSAKYKLHEQEDDEATVKVILNLKVMASALLSAIKDEDDREDLQDEIKEMDEEDFIKTATFKLALDDGKWVIIGMRNFDIQF